MTTTRIDLDGTWMFVHRLDRNMPPTHEREIVVPSPWQAQFPDLRMKVGLGLYRKQVDVPPEWFADRQIYLHFGAVFHLTTVWVNGTRIGAHEGGFLNFSFRVNDHLRPGTNEITVLAETPSDDIALYPDAPFAEIPFGKQSWYGPLSGIWQSVRLERREADHVERLHVRAAQLSGDVAVELAFRSPLSTAGTVMIEIVDPHGVMVASFVRDVGPGDASALVSLVVTEVSAWSPDAPNLYAITATLRIAGQTDDTITETFGFRSIETRDGAFYLNGERLMLRAALDQDYYPDTICTIPSEAFLEDQFRKAKALGLNCLRLHIKVPDPRYYAVADRLGLLIWTELPNGGLSTERSQRRKERLLKGIVDRDGNHPCIVIWTIINENWGVDLVHDAQHRQWLKRTYAWLKAYDPSRLVVDNSPLAPSFHVQTDIADYHFYAAIPDHRTAWDDFVGRLARSSAWLFSPEGDAVVRGDEPRLCSEFGNWGLPHPDHLAGADGQEPWWFETGHDWGDGVMYPHGIRQRFEDWSLDRIFGSLSGFVEAAQWQQFRALKYQIEAMRRHAELAGYVITEFTDVHWESNGLLDMRRNPRVFHDHFPTINADLVVVPHQERFAFWHDEPIRFRIAIANGGPRSTAAASLVVHGGTPGSIPVPPLASCAVRDCGAVSIDPDGNNTPGKRIVALELRDAAGTLLASNSVTAALYRRTERDGLRQPVVWSADPDIRAYVKALGYGTGFSLEDAEIVIATAPSVALAGYVRGGGRLLLLPTAPCALEPFFPHWQNVRVQGREGTMWQGDWASSFSWLRRAGPFISLPGDPLLDESFDRVLPSLIVTGCNLIDFQARVHAGMVVGWVHRPAALVVERSYGRGRLVTATLRLFRDAPSADPTATLLIHALVQLTGVARAQPAIAA